MTTQWAPPPRPRQPGGYGGGGIAGLQGRMEPTSRWLWLVKWFLLIPHVIALVFLFVAAFVLTVVAFFAILVSGRYPRWIFDFNVGVLRWGWRVGFYRYSALGTDRYPPFSLREMADYPATLDVPYPQHLSRGLVLVKSWLLAIPQYLVVAVLAGGTAFATHNDPRPATGLIGILVLVGAFTLLFTGRYPRDIFDLAVGLNRWVYRVLVYAMLMSDVYPPFRLDMGGEGPRGVVGPAIPHPPSPPPAPPPRFGPRVQPSPPPVWGA